MLCRLFFYAAQMVTMMRWPKITKILKWLGTILSGDAIKMTTGRCDERDKNSEGFVTNESMWLTRQKHRREVPLQTNNPSCSPMAQSLWLIALRSEPLSEEMCRTISPPGRHRTAIPADRRDSTPSSWSRKASSHAMPPQSPQDHGVLGLGAES